MEAVVAVDMALHMGLCTLADIDDYVSSNRRGWGVARVRKVAHFAEPATESPMETRLRMILVSSGLPRPEAQVTLTDGTGAFVARPDFLYRDARLAIEYDGAVHRDMLVDDDRRQNRLVREGYRLLRFTATDLAQPDVIAAQVRAALGAAT